MKILLVSWYFPPSNTIAAVRLGKLAKHLSAAGHELRILTAAEPPYPSTLPVEVDEKLVRRTGWRDISALPDRIIGLFRSKEAVAQGAAEVQGSTDGAKTTGTVEPDVETGSRLGALRQRLSSAYELLLGFPDIRVGWAPAAHREGLKIISAWRPDGIFASGPPFTTLLIGYLLSRATKVPLVIEFRDRWADDPYYPPPWWRRRLERWLEARIVNHATGLTTVSEPWAAAFRQRYAKPVAVIFNGYDAEDFGGQIGQGWPDPEVLRIGYAGSIYTGYRDPSPLFRAIGSAPELKKRVEVHFYGSDPQEVVGLARDHGVEDCVTVHDRVNHAESLKVQMASDVLLLMQWDNPREQGNVPGKFSEYLGARRPMLVLGLADGVPATEVRQRNAGTASTDPQVIARQLEDWIETKQCEGRLAPLSDQAVAGFSRQEQAAKLEQFLAECFQRAAIQENA